MTHLAYSHSPNVSIVGAMTRLFRRALPIPSTIPARSMSGRAWRSRILVCVGWILVLALQALLVLIVRDVITLCHGVIDLYLDLANLQLDLTSSYVAATTPK